MDIETKLMMKPQDAVTQAETMEAVSTIIQLRQQLAAAESKIDALTKELEVQSYWGPRWEVANTEWLAALAACEAKDTILRGITLYRAFNGDDWPAREATQALTINPDASALKAHDDALIEKIAQRMADSGIGGKYIAEAIRD